MNATDNATSGVSSDLLATMNGKRATQNATQEAQDRFLTLLVTQMKNQDPLNPLDNSQVTSQLAQLSTVSGIEKLNTAVNSLGQSFQSGQNLQAANMIGHGVIAAGNRIGLTEGKAILAVDLPQAVDDLTISIKNSAGLLVKTMSVPMNSSGLNTLTWDGLTDSGATAPDGSYTFDVKAVSAGKAVEATSMSFGKVSSVTSGAQGVQLRVENIGEVSMANVQQIY